MTIEHHVLTVDGLDSGGAVESTRCRACDGDLPDCRCKSLRTEGATAERARVVAWLDTLHARHMTHDEVSDFLKSGKPLPEE